MPFNLVRDMVSHDTVQALEHLLDAARHGHITGLAFACTLKGKRFITNTAGTCYHEPSFTRGLLLALDDELARMVQERADRPTR